VSDSTRTSEAALHLSPVRDMRLPLPTEYAGHWEMKPLPREARLKTTTIAVITAIGAEVSEREGSRVGVFLFGEVRVFHRPHPSPDTDKGAVASIRKWLDEHGVKP